MSTSANFLDPRLSQWFWDRVQPCPMTGCWIWIGAASWRGYGNITLRGDGIRTTRSAYRTAHLALVGSVPEGLEIDHLCRVPACCNPAHLEPVTHAENHRRSDAPKTLIALHASRVSCPKGHPFDEANTHIKIVDSYRVRICKICRAESNKRLGIKGQQIRAEKRVQGRCTEERSLPHAIPANGGALCVACAAIRNATRNRRRMECGRDD